MGRCLLSLILKNNSIRFYKSKIFRKLGNYNRFTLQKNNTVLLCFEKIYFMNYRNAINYSTAATKINANENKSADDSTLVIMKTIYKYTTSINHEDLVKLLNNCSSVKEQIEQMYSLISLSDEEKIERLELAKTLQHVLSSYFPNCKVILAGSSINGIGLKGCDIDLVFFTKWDPIMWVVGLTSLHLPTVEDIDSGRVPLSKLQQFSPKLQLRFVRRALQKHWKGFSSTVRLVAGRCPTLQFQYGSKHLNCDLSFGISNSSILSTKLVLFCGHLDSRFVPLARIINYWAKNLQLIGPLEKFKSYTFSLLIIYFLQTRNPPILPSVEDILKKTEFFNDILLDHNLSHDVSKFLPSENTQTLEELLREFFLFYLFFDFTHLICPLKGQTLSKAASLEYTKDDSRKLELGTPICIQDPFDENWNVTTGTSYKNCKSLVKEILSVCKMYQTNFKRTQSVNQHWGLSSLINTSFDREMLGENYVEFFLGNNHELDIISISTMSKNILKIFNYALLFKCDVIELIDFDSCLVNSHHFSNVKFRTDKTCDRMFDPVVKLAQLTTKKMNVSISEQTTLKMICTGINVCHGRWHWKQYFNNVENSLELEHRVSQQLTDMACDKESHKESQHFQFLCHCVQSRVDNHPNLKISLFPVNRDKFPSNVAVFLKEYIPELIVKIN